MSSREQDDRRVASALREVGLDVESVFDLVNANASYPEAIPVLLKMLREVSDDWIREGIVRALSVKEAKGVATQPLIEEFKKVGSKELFKWAIGNALSVLADDSVFDEVMELVLDKHHGKAREMLTLALGNMKNPRTVDILIEFLKDEQVAVNAIMALGKLRAKRARSAIEPFLNHRDAGVRQEAKRALAKIDKAK